MPEGPEVKSSVDYLDFVLANTTLLGVSVIGGKFKKKPPKGLDKVRFPLVFKDVKSKGKMLIFSFKDTNMKMFAGLGMTGQFRFSKDAHSAIQFNLVAPPGPFGNVMYYTDSRRFGNIEFSEDDLSAKLAPCILGGLTLPQFMERAKKLKTKRIIYAVFMDQQAVCSGIGNYLIAEILYYAGVNPHREFNTLNDEELRLIHEGAVKIAQMSYEKKGTSIISYVNPDGEKGAYSNFLQVYRKTHTPKGELVVADKVKGCNGRTVWWVPEVQV